MKVFPQNQSQGHSSRSPRLLGVIRSKYDEFVTLCFVCRSNYNLFHVSRMRPDLFKGNKELSSTICVRDVSTAKKNFPCHSQQLVSDFNP